MRRIVLWCCSLLAALVLSACAGGGATPAADRGAKNAEADAPAAGRHYLRNVVFAGNGDTFLIHWRKSKMPLKVHLPVPPGMRSDSGATAMTSTTSCIRRLQTMRAA